jgi:hypothetical protein
MKEWLQADDFVIDIDEGGNIEIPLTFGEEQYLIEGEIGLIMPNKKFTFTWIERDSLGEAWFNNTTVTIELEECEAGTRLTLIHDGFQYLPTDIRPAALKRYRQFWGMEGFWERLETLLVEP